MDEQRFARLTELVRDVLEDDTASLSIPHNVRTIQVQTAQARRFLDIDELGDGIKQVVMIGAAALRHSNTLVCLEEPEIHLHPGLQRKLVRHLRDRTSNQYLIATHSNAMLDLEGAAIFHVVHDGNTTRATAPVLVDDLVRVGDDLGYRASDLLQANYVIWVEGPADRLYWRRWLELFDEDLEEGVHFTIMSYGGSLIADLDLSSGADKIETDAEDSEETAQDLVDLLKLGRRCTLIADSDKSDAASALGPAAERVRSTASGTAQIIVPEWARTVENLLPPEVLQAAVRQTRPRAAAQYVAPKDPFARPFAGLRSEPPKAIVARHAVQLLTSRDCVRAEHADLICALARRIREANGIPGE